MIFHGGNVVNAISLRWSERQLKAAQPMFTEQPDQDALDVTGAVFRHLKMEADFPRPITADDLKGYKAPTLLLAAEKDIFFPARVIIPRDRPHQPTHPPIPHRWAVAGAKEFPPHPRINSQ